MWCILVGLWSSIPVVDSTHRSCPFDSTNVDLESRTEPDADDQGLPKGDVALAQDYDSYTSC